MIGAAVSPRKAVDERRKPSGRKAFRQGKIVLSKWTSLNCIIRELSDAGASLEFASFVTMPPIFTLAVSGRKDPLSVRLAWQQGYRAGVTIEPQASAPA